jgi:hypothetical protein
MYRYKILTQNNTELTRRKKNVQNRWMRGKPGKGYFVSCYSSSSESGAKTSVGRSLYSCVNLRQF